MLELIYKMQPLDYVYLLVGIILFIFAIQSFLDKEHKYRIGTGLFWLLYSVSLSLVLIYQRKSMAGSLSPWLLSSW